MEAIHGTPQTSGTTNPLYSVFFTNTDTGTAIGGSGTILRTTDGGGTWNPQTSGTTAILQSVHFTDANNGAAVGFAVGSNTTILHTTNGGTTWTPQTSSAPGFLTLFTVFFADINNGTTVGVGTAGTNILHTTNGGATWTGQTSGTAWGVEGVSFINANIGIAVGQEGTIQRTTNGGATWTPQSAGPYDNLNSVFFFRYQHRDCCGRRGKNSPHYQRRDNLDSANKRGHGCIYRNSPLPIPNPRNRCGNTRLPCAEQRTAARHGCSSQAEHRIR